ncbi:MAG: DJ-1/PfpI family protein [Bacteroidales bacterium]|nr:DJ-1/PfpI family protein [Bacteroidales bacterium]
MKRVLLLLSEGFEFYEAAVFIDVMGWNLEDGDGSTRLFTCGLRKEIKSSFDQRLVVDYLADEVDPADFDALAIPGGFEVYGFYKDAYDEKFLQLIRTFKAQDKMIASICSGALPVGKSGILKGKRCTTYNMKVRREALKEFGGQVVHEPIVVTDKIITSWNPWTALNVALMLLEELTSKENADKIRGMMGF